MAHRRDTIVQVSKPASKKYYVMRWVDPRNGKVRQESTGETRKRDADKKAAAKELKIRQGLSDSEEVPWAAFRLRYEEEKKAMQRANSLASWVKTANRLEKIIKPRFLIDVDGKAISKFSAQLHNDRCTLGSIGLYLREIKAALNWAVDIYPGYRPPKIVPPKQPKGGTMKGRPITAEEFDRMLDSVKPVLAERIKNDALKLARCASAWQYLLRGLYFSGLRLGEALELSWDSDAAIHIHDIQKRRPMLAIAASADKGKRDHILPLTPDFVGLLKETPEPQRRGRVFSTPLARVQNCQPGTVSAMITDFGKHALIVVRRREDGQRLIKYASAHDLRRAFGDRWSSELEAVDLMKLMRHDSIETTLKYYVKFNAERTADKVWQAFSDLSRDPTTIEGVTEDAKKSLQD